MSKFYKRPEGPEPSEMFLDSISGGYGSSELTCDFCGKTHMAYLAYDYSRYDEEDSISWQRNCDNELKLNPNVIVIHYDWYVVEGKQLDGRTYVTDCDCNSLWRYENWIWRNRETIRNYLKLRCDKEKQLADEEHLQNVIAGIK